MRILFLGDIVGRWARSAIVDQLGELKQLLKIDMAIVNGENAASGFGITEKIANAGTIYFAGRNDGVAEELTLKTNEITRKKSDFLEGTYAVHGIEEVMNSDDVVVLINPFKSELEKIKEGDVIASIFSMNIEHEIKAEKDFVIKKILLEANDPVDYGKPLFLVQ